MKPRPTTLQSGAGTPDNHGVKSTSLGVVPRLGRVLLVALLLAFSGAGLAACGGGHDMDLADESMLPEFVRSAPDAVQEAYRFAIANPEDLAHQPCYCGCGPMGHRSNLGCFIEDISADGTITFDDHALGCGICVDIAQDVMRMTAEGKSPAEIRQFVDARYGKFGPPTPTPLPPG